MGNIRWSIINRGPCRRMDKRRCYDNRWCSSLYSSIQANQEDQRCRRILLISLFIFINSKYLEDNVLVGFTKYFALISLQFKWFLRFGLHYEYPLLIQSLVMNVTMFMMIHLCVKVRNRNQLAQARQRIFTGMNLM